MTRSLNWIQFSYLRFSPLVYMLKNAEVFKERELCIVFYFRFLMKIVQIPRSWDLTRDFWAAYHMPLIYTFLNLNTKSITTSFLQPNLIFEIFNHFFSETNSTNRTLNKEKKEYYGKHYLFSLFLTPRLAPWPLRGHRALKSILWKTLFLDQLHDFPLLS